MLHRIDPSLSPEETVKIIERSCGAGVFSIDLTLFEITVSAGLGSLLGLAYERRSYGLADIARMLHPLDRLSGQEALELLEQGGPSQRDIRIITPLGSMRWLNVQFETLVDPTGVPARLIGIVNDATSDRRDEGRWAVQRDRLRTLVLGVAPIVWAAKPDGSLTEMIGWQSVTGMRDCKALGNDWIEAVHVEDREPMLGQWFASIERKSACDSQIRLLQGDGNYRYFRVYGVPRLHKSGSLRDWNGMAIDVHPQVVARRLVMRNIVTGAQIRAARAILKWSVADLCKASGLTPAVIRRLESNDGISRKPAAALDAIAATLRKAGVEFIFDDGSVPGVRPS